MEQPEYKFYRTTSTYESAKQIIPNLKNELSDVKSIMDIGCGAGGFIKAFEDSGITNYFLVDHPSLNVDRILPSNKTRFIACDLDKDLPPINKVDLICCTEVLEHLELSQALNMLKYMCECADLILFSAAIPRQGGLGHINEQRHSFWHQKFANQGYKFYDGFKIEILMNSKIDYWFIQNLFIYYSPAKAFNFSEMKNISSSQFELVSTYVLNKPYGIKESLFLLSKSILNYFKRLKQ